MFERELKTQASHGTGNPSVFDYLIAWQYASITERIFRLTTPLEGALFKLPSASRKNLFN